MARTPASRDATVLRPLSEANHESGSETIALVVRLLHGIIRPLTKRDWRHQEKLPPTGGLIIVSNHISNVDPLSLGQFIAFSGRWPRFLGKASVFKLPVIGAILKACGQLPVERQSARSADALLAVTQAITAGRAVVIYPEGTITGDPDLWPMEGKTGAARIALQTGCPVVPIGQWGAQDVMHGKRLHFPRLLPRKTFQMIIGDPVPLDDLREPPVTAAILKEATARMMDAVTSLVAELRESAPPATRYDPRSTPEDDRR